eukprot:CAMPEP_0174890036 /NCGR_PEP_ID=MMETSP0167-20121228/5211_1 /TAXON_ID=38298 /ORGANISM="Rhodella maculata, Strain CCMP736" /LENGTH=62 /DNA_ID=CAMNT_0016127675 /DNA_START=88 /DNA_END=273 /DNA_ORIENTATION=+
MRRFESRLPGQFLPHRSEFMNPAPMGVEGASTGCAQNVTSDLRKCPDSLDRTGQDRIGQDRT